MTPGSLRTIRTRALTQGASSERSERADALNQVVGDSAGEEFSGGVMKIRNRIVETRTVLARDLLSNPRNWRRPPKPQADALKALLREIGIADALLARELPDQRLMLVDGHLR